MESNLLYCSTCGKHTPHVSLTDMYATACTVCHSQTNQLMRVQAEHASAVPLVAPDGSPGVIVENTPKKVVFFVEAGEHRGYYEYDKQRKSYSISQA